MSVAFVWEQTQFLLPPITRNSAGDLRKVGFELEYNNLDIQQSARLVQQVFGGEHVVESTFVHHVETRHGRFSIEIDASILKDKSYQKPLRGLGLDPEKQWLEETLLGAFSTVVPIEISAPPIAIDELRPMDELRRLLHEHGAQGTRAALLHAFGMHINPEAPSTDPATLRDFLRAFLLLYPWMKRRHEVDLARTISPYINAFPMAYVRIVLAEDYPASAERLIDDYLEHNPTRNRPLDMLPVLAHLDRDRVMAHTERPDLVKPRPALHYRLPNCMVDEPNWTLAQEWNVWVAVERLANDPQKLSAMSRDFFQADEQSFRPFIDHWPNMLEQYLSER